MLGLAGSTTLRGGYVGVERSLVSKAFLSGQQWCKSFCKGSSLKPRPVLPGGRHRVFASTSKKVFSVAAVPPPSRKSVDAPKQAHGFDLIKQEFVKEYDSDVLLYKHAKTGAQVLSLVNDDENKTFSAIFRTPVSNSQGVPHILEHSVLAGSKKYPMKEPFVELIKGSLNTFINAMTYPDRTLYPVASCNLQDYYNLVDVYLDAVFFPKCLSDRMIFEQEGWHYELDSEDSPLAFKGVVFNEMKGVYSSADSANYRAAMQSIFPDNNYRHDSGGNPEEIPNLTFEDFKNFHGSYYHPSNAKFWFYGNDAPVERLRILGGYLDQFEKRDVDSKVKKQPMLKEPRTVVDTYSAGEGEEKCFVSLNYLLSEEAFDTETGIAVGFLEYLLLGTPAAPLYKALNDSGLGESVTGFGIEDDMLQPFFGIGLKGVKPEDTDKVEKVIIDELKRLRKEGFAESAVEAAINTIEFSLRENNTGNFPRGLSLMTKVVAGWIYDKDPLEEIKWESPLANFKEKLASGEDVFGPLIQKYILDNPHKVVFKMEPDQSKAAAIEADEKKKLEDFRSKLETNDVESIVKSTTDLKVRQETPDPPEVLKLIPSLKLSDIPKEITKIPTAEDQEGGATFLTHDIFTNNILYLDMVLELRTVPENLLPLVPLFCEALTNMGTQSESFVELTERIGRKTGALSVFPYVTSKKGTKEPVAKIMVQGKSMKDKVGDMADLMRDILLTVNFNDADRFKQMVLETKSGLESGIVSGGNSFASMRLSAQRSTAGYVNELMGGLSYLEYIRELVDRVENDWSSVANDLESLRKILVNRQGAIINMTADEGTLTASRPALIGLLDALPSDDVAMANWSTLLPRVNEALTVPTQVNYVGKAINLYEDAGYELNGSANVIEKYLFTTWLWEKVRAVGGAYGCRVGLNHQSGQLCFTSYRDPNIQTTLDSYDGSAEFLRTLKMDDDAVTKAVIGAISDVDRHQLPDAKGFTALGRRLLGVTDEERQERRDQILSTKCSDFNNMADFMDSVKSDSARVVVVTSADAAKKYSEENPGFWEEKTVL
ncbi:hypothetical protein BSKO_02022 [Bryopsis sp. KO-2023]|nr:hypothetical protein BSKO_02022 [Bryopsis sp. KO-2023]